jgi:hypothetical protein
MQGEYLRDEEKQFHSLISQAYMAKLGRNGKIILMHSFRLLPGDSEVDVSFY